MAGRAGRTGAGAGHRPGALNVVGNDSFAVNGTPASTALTINGLGGIDSLSVNDFSSPTGNSYTVTGSPSMACWKARTTSW